MLKVKLSIILFMSIFQFSIAQNDAYNAFKIADEKAKEDPENYLAPVKALENIAFDSTDNMAKNMIAQALMTYYSFLGDYEKTLEASISRYGSPRPTAAPISYDTAFLQNYSLMDAKDHILQVADQRQVIMINEAHHIPHHRAFVLNLLDDLYQKGFRYLALETLSDATINEQAYPDQKSGFYSREPLFGEMLREALRLGYTLVRYENELDCDNRSSDRFYCNSFRDSIQALNLKNRVFEQDPKAKLLVYAGYAHIEKGSKNSWKKMAQFFQEITGIDPYCIEQTRMNEQGDIGFEGKTYRTLADKIRPEDPVVAFQNGQAFSTSEYVDINIFHPRSNKLNDRSDFYSIYGKRKAFLLNELTLQKGQLVQAFYQKETGQRIPADQFMVKTGKETLFLFPGTYELIIRSNSGEVLTKKEIWQR